MTKQESKSQGQQQQQGAPDQKSEAHPSHYEPAKQDLKTERELRAGAIASTRSRR
jgi:hypothetical protein